MSQELEPQADILVGIFLPEPVYVELAAGSEVTGTVDEITTSPALTVQLAAPLQIPTQNTAITIAFHTDLVMNVTGQWDDYQYQVNHPVFGNIAALSDFVIAPPLGINVVSKSILLDDLMALFSTDPTTFFASNLEFFFSCFASPILPATTFGGSVDFGVFSFTIPDAGPSADIEIIGDGGIELSGEADMVGFPLSITGAGGIELGQDPLVPTPLVVSADVSGIYTLVPERHFDRVYSRNTDPAQTQDVAIPTPYAKTGYFGA